MNLWSPGGRAGEGSVREFGRGMYTQLHLKWIINKVLPQSTGTSAQSPVAAQSGGELGAERL